jgi:Na+/proline symporter
MEEPRLLTKEELIGSFGWEEYLVLSLMLLVSTLIGIYFACKGQKSNAEYLLGGRRMGVFPVSMSLTAT